MLPDSLALNADTNTGSIDIALLDPHTGSEWTGFGRADCSVPSGDGVLAVTCSGGAIPSGRAATVRVYVSGDAVLYQLRSVAAP